MTSRIVAAVSIVLFALPSVAQPRTKSVVGNVVKIAEKSITIQTKDTPELEVELTSKTKYEKNGVSAALSDLKVGERVVVQADQNGDTLTATSLRFRTELRLDRRNPKYPPKANLQKM